MTLKERERIEKEDIEKWLKQKVDVECKVTNCRQSGTVTIAKIESEEKKREIMRKKYKLRGEKFYIENDLSWEERRTQEQITRWAKGQRAKGEEIKVGFGRIRIKGRWKSWAKIKQEEEKEKIKRKEISESRVGRRETEFCHLSQEEEIKTFEDSTSVVNLGKERKCIFWNVAGLFNKDKEFWRYIRKFYFISMSETWIDVKGWEYIKDRLPDSHEWVCSYAVREKKRKS